MPKVQLGDVARERKETCKGSKAGYPIVGLEHLVPEEITLTAWNDGGENTFSKLFHKGDILFGRRRAYLKKAAVAPFDGICSGDITVIEANAEKIFPALLPFIIQNDDLFDFAVGKSAGSLSPRVKWEHLKNYEFQLPDMEKQRELAELLWAMDATKKAYKKLITATDELVKSQFLEQFGDPRFNPKGYPVQSLSEVASYWNGLTYKPEDVSDFGTIVLRSSNIQDGKLAFDDVVRVTCDIRDRAYVEENDILMCSRNGSADLVGKVALIDHLDEPMAFGAFMMIIRSTYYDYLLQYFNTHAFREQINTGTATINQITNKMLDQVRLPIPQMAEIKKFAAFVQQSDKSKNEVEQALLELTATTKKIIKENIGKMEE